MPTKEEAQMATRQVRRHPALGVLRDVQIKTGEIKTKHTH